MIYILKPNTTKATWLQIVKRAGFVVHDEWIFSIDLIAFKPQISKNIPCLASLRFFKAFVTT
jgi:hypothetical protein